MPRTSNSKINTFFSFQTGSWLNWSDEAAPKTETETEYETQSEQSIDSCHSSDFFFGFDPAVERMIIASRAKYLQKLESNIKATAPKVTKFFEQNRFKQQIAELDLLGSILEKTTPKVLEALVPQKTENQSQQQTKKHKTANNKTKN